MVDDIDIDIQNGDIDNGNQNNGDDNQQQEEQTEPVCEIKYWLDNIDYPTDTFNQFENWIIKALKIKAPEFKDDFEEITTDLVEKYRFLIQEAVNETDYDIFVIGKRDCEKEYTPPENIDIEKVIPFYLADITKRFKVFSCCKIPIYDYKELQLAFAFYIANSLTLANKAINMPVGGITEELVAGSVRINPKTTNTDKLNTSYYSLEYDKIIKRRKIIRREILVANSHISCCNRFNLCHIINPFLKK